MDQPKAERIHIVQGPPGTGKTTMTVAIICRYILESKAMNSSSTPKLLVCGPTNKSVIVLAQKTLQIIRKDDSQSIKAVLIGDKSELLSDDRGELEGLFVFSYTKNMWKRWKSIRTRLLRKQNNIDQLIKEIDEMVYAEMKRRLPGVGLYELEKALDNVKEKMKRIGSSEFDENKEKVEELKEALNDVSDALKGLDEQKVVQALLESADVIFCTLSTTGSMPIRRMGEVSRLIVDEASACSEAEVLVPLHKRPKKLLLVGDPKQLPATVQSPQAIDFGFAQSLQERLMFKNKFDYTLLDVQYRMRPEISRWPVSQFYNGAVQDGNNVMKDNYVSRVALMSGEPYVWVQVSGEEQKDKRMSTLNESEGEAIVNIILEMETKHNLPDGWFTPERLRIITFYKTQEDYIRFKLKQYHLDVMVSTVDAGQGCEADMVVLSFVRGTSGHIGFIKDTRRLNVALTRAKHQLVCVGNANALVGLAQRGGNLVAQDLAQDSLARSVEAQAPGPLPPPPQRSPVPAEDETTKSKQKKTNAEAKTTKSKKKKKSKKIPAPVEAKTTNLKKKKKKKSK